MTKSTVIIRAGDPHSPGATALLKASHALMEASFPAESNHHLSIDALTAPGILFFGAEINGAAVGCAALVLHSDYGEVKSMFVDPARRGARIGAKLLDHLEAEARTRNLHALRLETGDSLIAAQKLYFSRGFTVCPPFGAYTPDPRSLFMEKPL